MFHPEGHIGKKRLRRCHCPVRSLIEQFLTDEEAKAALGLQSGQSLPNALYPLGVSVQIHDTQWECLSHLKGVLHLKSRCPRLLIGWESKRGRTG